MRRPRAGSTQAVTRGTPGLRPPPLGAGARSWLKARRVLLRRAEARSRGIYKRRGGTGVTRTPARVERREAWTPIARRPPRLTSVASAASRTRRHMDAPRGAPPPLTLRGDGFRKPRGVSARENAACCLKFGTDSLRHPEVRGALRRASKDDGPVPGAILRGPHCVRAPQDDACVDVAAIVSKAVIAGLVPAISLR
jgi:hypothetical protein